LCSSFAVRRGFKFTISDNRYTRDAGNAESGTFPGVGDCGQQYACARSATFALRPQLSRQTKRITARLCCAPTLWCSLSLSLSLWLRGCVSLYRFIVSNGGVFFIATDKWGGYCPIVAVNGKYEPPQISRSRSVS
jgi:hypothetical protein